MLVAVVFLALTVGLLGAAGSASTAAPVSAPALAPATSLSGPAAVAAKTVTKKCQKNKRGKKKCKGRKQGRNDPRYRRGLFVDDLMPAYQAGGVYRELIGKKAQALWITDYYHSPRSARSAVAAYTSRAAAQNKTPIMAIYAIPGRDCGLFSAGGLSSYQAYRKWASAAAQGMSGRKAIVVIEPDAVPFMGDSRCVDAGPRQKAIAFAVKKFSKAGAWVYIDGGHSGWRDPSVMAQLLKRSGMRWARGFSTNIGNHRLTSSEHSYGKQVVRALAKVGLKNRKYVTETARNGANPAPVNGDVCNPTSARVGKRPRLLFRGAFDGYLWIKHPGESDGECNGGPSSGAWWPEGALSLLGR